MEYEDAYLHAESSKYDCLVFDLDDTLYPFSSGIATACSRNIADFMVEKLGIETSKITYLSKLLYQNYGTTMAGLKAIGYDFDDDEYHRFVHGRLPYQNLKPDPILRNLLLSMPIRKIVFTNSDIVHAHRVVKMLGIEDCFERLICFETLNPLPRNSLAFDEEEEEEDDSELESYFETLNPLCRNSLASNEEDDVSGFASCFETLNPLRRNSLASDEEDDDSGFASCFETLNPLRCNSHVPIFDIVGHCSHSSSNSPLPISPILCKPSEAAIHAVLRIANINPKRTLLLDDSVRNIEAGKRVGLDTVIVGASQRVTGADFSLESIHNLKEAIPELWESDTKIKSQQVAAYSGTIAVETYVRA